MTRAATVSPPESVPSDVDRPAPLQAGRPGRIRSARDFDALRRTPLRSRGRGPVRVAFVPGGGDRSRGGDVRVAYAIGRRVGGAVVRNRLRRRLRAVLAARCRAGRLPPGDYLVSVAPEAAELPFSELEATVTAALASIR